jgi:hypothetical protein
MAQEGTYLIYLDTTHDQQGATQDVSRRPITVADPYKPEFRLDVQIKEEKGTVGGRYQLYAWDGTTWQEMTLTGGTAIAGGSPTVIEVQLPKTILNNPPTLQLAVVSAGKGRVHTAVDVLGSDFAPQTLDEAVVLDVFAEYKGNP